MPKKVEKKVEPVEQTDVKKDLQEIKELLAKMTSILNDLYKSLPFPKP